MLRFTENISKQSHCSFWSFFLQISFVQMRDFLSIWFVFKRETYFTHTSIFKFHIDWFLLHFKMAKFLLGKSQTCNIMNIFQGNKRKKNYDLTLSGLKVMSSFTALWIIAPLVCLVWIHNKSAKIHPPVWQLHCQSPLRALQTNCPAY